MDSIYLTGDRPTGKLHLGHYVGSLKNRIIAQEQKKTTQYIMIADQQGLTDNADNPQKIRQHVNEVLLDYLSVGIDPSKSTIFVQSQIPQLAELTMYYLNLVNVSRLYRNPTVKSEMKEKKFTKSVPTGFLIYPVSQAADITAFKTTHVAVGGDQLPMIEQTKEIVRSFNRTYKTSTLIEPNIILPSKQNQRLRGLDGQGKMSKSLNNAIYLSDDEETIKKKVMSMYTDPNHIYINDPGKIEGNMVFDYLDIFSQDQNKVAKLKEEYQKGGLGDVKIKLYLNEVLQELLSPIRKRRQSFEREEEYLKEILKSGCLLAEEKADNTLNEVKEAMGINYF
ncbi:tryptophan--tRNA ligase [Vagococcus fluvialis]|uniref:tryptophan--tRNA ligase n=1 Tax=Vagococcus fluvialis TaxID=2738 RepID=UPI003B5A1A40